MLGNPIITIIWKISRKPSDVFILLGSSETTCLASINKHNIDDDIVQEQL